MVSVNRPTNPCKNPDCGNTLFLAEQDYKDGKFSPVWHCTNCSWNQPRQTRNRRTNYRRALDLYFIIRKEWEETDKALDVLIAQDNPNRIPSGCLLVHSSLFNHHLSKLSGSEKLSNWAVRYHVGESRKELEQAKEFVRSKNRES